MGRKKSELVCQENDIDRREERFEDRWPDKRAESMQVYNEVIKE